MRKDVQNVLADIVSAVKNNYKFVFDSDTYLYKLAWFNKDINSNNVVESNTIKYILDLFKLLNTTKHESLLLLTSSINKRKELYKEYKGQRVSNPEISKWLSFIKEVVKSKFNTLTLKGYEADDIAASILHINPNIVLVHEDKDLLQIVGKHYYKNELFSVTDNESVKFLLKQLLTGDKTDNIKGVPGIGIVGAEKIVNNNSIINSLDEIINEYIKYYKNMEEGIKMFYINFKMLKLHHNLLNTNER